MIRIICSLLLFAPHLLIAQFKYTFDQTISVEGSGGQTLRMPWTGGLNAAQYNTMDLNGDLKEDLVVYDRMANKVFTFLNINQQYVYSPDYEAFFPEKTTSWMLLRDFNCDGKKDLFTGDVFGIKVFTNTSIGNTLSWKQFLFNTGSGSVKDSVILTKGFSGKINLQLQFDDLPAIADIDADGDLDILTMSYPGNGTMEFHQNFSQERYGTCDSLDYERMTQQWGGVRECGCGNFSFNNTLCASSGGRTKHAGGKSLLTLDANGDGVQDILISEAECNVISLLANTGNVANPIINTSTNFPLNNASDFFQYPTAYFEDVDFDGEKDLMVAPNIFHKEEIDLDLAASNWFYHNAGSTTNPNFVFQRQNFLQEDMIDVGDNAVPALFDYDYDNDLDLFISNNNFPATIRLYKNTGTSKHPSFKFEEPDFHGLSVQQLTNVRIQFIDINNDNKIDLTLVATSPTTGLTKLYYLLNNSSSGLDFVGQSLQETSFTLASAENLLLTEINNDGNVDLLLGKSNGMLEFWKNTGSLNFFREQNDYLALGPSVLRQNIACAVSDLNADQKMDLVLADQTGQLQIISNFKEAEGTDAIQNVVYNELSSSYGSPNIGGRLWPTIANLYETDGPVIVVGTVLGGLRILRSVATGGLPKNPVINIYPNPVRKTEMLSIDIDRQAQIQLFSTLGQPLTQPLDIPANEIVQIEIPNIARGLYIIGVTVNKNSYARRLVIY